MSEQGKKFTGQDIHAAFVHASSEEGKPPLIDMLGDWNKVDPYAQERYARMADYLNQQVETEQEQDTGRGEETQEKA